MVPWSANGNGVEYHSRWGRSGGEQHPEDMTGITRSSRLGSDGESDDEKYEQTLHKDKH